MRNIILLVLGVLLISGRSYAAEEDSPLTKGQFAYILANFFEIKMPDGSDTLPKQEVYSIMAKELADKKGIGYFIGAQESDAVMCADMAEVLYSILKIEEKRDKYSAMRFLIDKGYMKPCDSDSLITFRSAQEMLNNPSFRDSLRAEGYQEPADRDLTAEPYTEPNTDIIREPVGAVSEQAASQII